MNITIKKLKFFIEVSRAQNFTKASQKLGVSQPALTIAINDLETSLGTKLFHRNRNQLQLTPAGQVLFERACKLVDEFEGIPDVVRRGADMKICRFGMTASSFITMANFAYDAAVEQNCNEIEFQQMDYETLPYAVLKGDVHFGITPKCYSMASLSHIDLWQEIVGVAFPKEESARFEKRPETWSELRNLELIVPNKNSFLAEELSRHQVFSQAKGNSYLTVCNMNWGTNIARQLRKPIIVPSTVYFNALADDFEFFALAQPKVIRRVYLIFSDKHMAKGNLHARVANNIKSWLSGKSFVHFPENKPSPDQAIFELKSMGGRRTPESGWDPAGSAEHGARPLETRY